MLTQNLKVRVRLVQQEDSTLVCVHVCQEEQSLLKAPPRRRQVESSAALPVSHHDLATLRNVPRYAQLGPEQVLDVVDEFFPL